MKSHLQRLLVVGLGVAAVSCVGDMPAPTADAPGLPGSNDTAGDDDNTFPHESETDPFEILDRMQAEGPPSYSSRVHSCMKMKYATLGRILAARGVVLTNTVMTSAGFLYSGGQQAVGVANYPQRQAEATDLTTAGASKILDIFASAAPEIIAAMPNRTECAVGGVNAQMFDAAGACTARGIECITGLPASAPQIELCSQIVTHASSPTKGRNMAVAVTMAAAHICE